MFKTGNTRNIIYKKVVIDKREDINLCVPKSVLKNICYVCIWGLEKISDEHLIIA